MAGDWIKMRVDVAGDPAVVGIANLLGVEDDLVVGKLHRLWSWADAHAQDGKAPLITAKWIDRLVAREGFAHAMQSVGWLKISENGVSFPHFDRHNGASAKSRGQAQLRVAKHRAAKSCNAPSVTKALPEKRREETEKSSVVLSEQQGGGVGESEAPQVCDNGKPAKTRRNRTDAPQSTIPPALDTEAFRAAFVEWRAYRREIRKPITPSSENRIFTKLERMGHDNAIASINQSIANGWTGLFDVKPENGRGGGDGNKRLGRVEAPPGKYDWIDKQ